MFCNLTKQLANKSSLVCNLSRSRVASLSVLGSKNVRNLHTSEPSAYKKRLSLDTLNTQVLKAEYAVRGAIPSRAEGK